MMTDFVTDVKAGRHSEHGWPNTCYGMSKLGLIAYTHVRAEGCDRWWCKLIIFAGALSSLLLNTPCNTSIGRLVWFRLWSDSSRLAVAPHLGFGSSPTTASWGVFARGLFSHSVLFCTSLLAADVLFVPLHFHLANEKRF